MLKEGRDILLQELRDEHHLWSYDNVQSEDVSDEKLIELSLIHLDIPELKVLFATFAKSRIKKVWRDRLLPQGEWLHSINRLYAWYYFGIKNPDAYLKSMETRRLNALCN